MSDLFIIRLCGGSLLVKPHTCQFIGISITQLTLINAVIDRIPPDLQLLTLHRVIIIPWPANQVHELEQEGKL